MRTLCLALLIFLAMSLSAQSGQKLGCSQGEHSKWIASVLKDMQSIGPGMKRADLSTLLAPESGFHVDPYHQTFVYRGSSYVKIDIAFTAADPSRQRASEDPNDVVQSVSRPYLSATVID
jgi:hypothetical protein